MSASALALVGYVAWTILLLTTILFYRTVLVLKNERAANHNATEKPVVCRACKYFRTVSVYNFVNIFVYLMNHHIANADSH